MGIFASTIYGGSDIFHMWRVSWMGSLITGGPMSLNQTGSEINSG
jgi:hypothetical protein